MLGWIFKPFERDISYKKLTGLWLLFFISGITLKTILTPLSPSFMESEEQMASSFCTIENCIVVFLAPLIETFLFFILPYWWKGIKLAKVTIIIWVLLHLASSIPIALYIGVMAIFYFRCLEIRKFKEIVLFHGLINWIGLLTCL